MSNNPTPKAVKAKPSFPTTTIFVRRGGELFISRDKLPNVNRVLSSKQFEDGTEVKLMLVFGDVYRMRSKGLPNFGPSFVASEEVTTTTHAIVTAQGMLVETKSTYNGGFVPLTFNNTLTGEVYNKLINVMTLDRHLVNVTVNEPFSLRDMSKSPNVYLGNGMLLYHISYEYVDGKMVIKNSQPLTVQEAQAFIEAGIKPDTFLLRQHIRDSKAIQVAFEPENPAIHYIALSDLLRESVQEANVDRKGDRYNVTVNTEAFK